MKMMKNKKLVWIVQAILLVAFLIFGAGKFLVSPEDAVLIFGKIGGATSQYLTGAYEIISAILVIIPQTAFIGALMIVISMSVAIVLHILVIGVVDVIPLFIVAIVFLLLAIYVIKARKKDVFWKR